MTPPPLSGAIGETVTITASPMSETRDTLVRVAGLAATVTDVTRTGCDECDQCRDDAGCATCGLCSGITLEPADRRSCFGDPLADPVVPSSCDACVETVTFVVPAAAVGPTTLVILNREGQSGAIPFEVAPALPTDSGETGLPVSTP